MLVDGIIDGHPDEWARCSARTAGDDKAEKKLNGFFVGKVMQQSKGQADGRLVTERLETRLDA